MSAYIDESFYSAYVNALMDGRTRKNDPFGAKDDSAKAPLPESIFSIQFLPAYMIALPARMFGASASTAFIVLIAMSALFSSLAVFGLLNSITSDDRLAAAGTLFVLCLGAFAGSYGVFGTFVDVAIPGLPFLRRYQPAVAFPLFFIFQLMVWRALTSEHRRTARLSTIVAGISLAALIFSYVYLWTAAAAWLACIGILCGFFRPPDRLRTFSVLATIGGITAIALLPYVYLASQQAATMDEHLIVVSSHRPDLFRVHEILGAIVLIVLVVAVRRGAIKWTEPRAIYATSLALLPFVVFNQQVLTGKTMQAFHFEAYVINYSTAVGLMITTALLWRPVPSRVLIWMAALSLAWGVFAVGLTARVITVPFAVRSDQKIPVLLRLKELSTQDGTLAALRTEGKAPTLVFSPDLALIDLLPSWAPQGTLIDVEGLYCGTVTWDERKEFFYMHLYYSKAETDAWRKALNGIPANPSVDGHARSVIFGNDRITRALSPGFEPIQQDEIEREVKAYEGYATSFSREQVLKRQISYAIFPAEGAFDAANLDRWYERDAGERVGVYTLYRLKLRN